MEILCFHGSVLKLQEHVSPEGVPGHPIKADYYHDDFRHSCAVVHVCLTAGTQHSNTLVSCATVNLLAFPSWQRAKHNHSAATTCQNSSSDPKLLPPHSHCGSVAIDMVLEHVQLGRGLLPEHHMVGVASPQQSDDQLSKSETLEMVYRDHFPLRNADFPVEIRDFQVEMVIFR